MSPSLSRPTSAGDPTCPSWVIATQDQVGRDGQSETVGKASHPVKICINDVAHAMTHHRSDAHASACQKVLRSDSRYALVTSRSVRYVFSYVFSKVHSTLRWYVSMKPCQCTTIDVPTGRVISYHNFAMLA